MIRKFLKDIKVKWENRNWEKLDLVYIGSTCYMTEHVCKHFLTNTNFDYIATHRLDIESPKFNTKTLEYKFDSVKPYLTRVAYLSCLSVDQYKCSSTNEKVFYVTKSRNPYLLDFSTPYLEKDFYTTLEEYKKEMGTLYKLESVYERSSGNSYVLNYVTPIDELKRAVVNGHSN